MAETLENRVLKMTAEVFGVAPSSITMSTTRDDIENWDSINIMHLVMAIESEFGVELEPEDAGELFSVELVVAILREKGVE